MYILASQYSDKKKFYLATSTGDVANLPRFGVEGTQGTNPTDDSPCIYGSTCLVATGSESTVYMLMPDNQWKKL